MVETPEDLQAAALGIFLALSLAFDPKAFTFETGVVFRGLTVTEKPEGFNIIIRGRGRSKEPLYAMTQHESPSLGLLSLMKALSTKHGRRMWHHDRFAP